MTRTNHRPHPLMRCGALLVTASLLITTPGASGWAITTLPQGATIGALPPDKSQKPMVPAGVATYQNTQAVPSNVQEAAAVLSLAAGFASLSTLGANVPAVQKFPWTEGAYSGAVHKVTPQVSDVVGTINGNPVTAADLGPGGRYEGGIDWNSGQMEKIAANLLQNDAIERQNDAIELSNKLANEKFTNGQADNLKRMFTGSLNDDSVSNLQNMQNDLTKELQDNIRAANGILVYETAQANSITHSLTAKYGTQTFGLDDLILHLVNGYDGKKGKIELQRLVADSTQSKADALKYERELDVVNHELCGSSDPMCLGQSAKVHIQMSKGKNSAAQVDSHDPNAKGLYAIQSDLNDQLRILQKNIGDLNDYFLIPWKEDPHSNEKAIADSLTETNDPSDTTHHPARVIKVTDAIKDMTKKFNKQQADAAKAGQEADAAKAAKEAIPPPQAAPRSDLAAQAAQVERFKNGANLINHNAKPAATIVLNLGDIKDRAANFDPDALGRKKYGNAVDAVAKDQKAVDDLVMAPYRNKKDNSAWKHTQDILTLREKAKEAQDLLKKNAKDVKDLADKVKSGEVDLQKAVAMMMCKPGDVGSPRCDVGNNVRLITTQFDKNGDFNQKYIAPQNMALAFNAYSSIYERGGFAAMDEYQKYQDYQKANPGFATFMNIQQYLDYQQSHPDFVSQAPKPNFNVELSRQSFYSQYDSLMAGVNAEHAWTQQQNNQMNAAQSLLTQARTVLLNTPVPVWPDWQPPSVQAGQSVTQTDDSPKPPRSISGAYQEAGIFGGLSFLADRALSMPILPNSFGSSDLHGFVDDYSRWWNGDPAKSSVSTGKLIDHVFALPKGSIQTLESLGAGILIDVGQATGWNGLTKFAGDVQMRNDISLSQNWVWNPIEKFFNGESSDNPKDPLAWVKDKWDTTGQTDANGRYLTRSGKPVDDITQQIFSSARDYINQKQTDGRVAPFVPLETGTLAIRSDIDPSTVVGDGTHTRLNPNNFDDLLASFSSGNMLSRSMDATRDSDGHATALTAIPWLANAAEIYFGTKAGMGAVSAPTVTGRAFIEGMDTVKGLDGVAALMPLTAGNVVSAFRAGEYMDTALMAGRYALTGAAKAGLGFNEYVIGTALKLKFSESVATELTTVGASAWNYATGKSTQFLTNEVLAATSDFTGTAAGMGAAAAYGRAYDWQPSGIENTPLTFKGVAAASVQSAGSLAIGGGLFLAGGSTGFGLDVYLSHALPENYSKQAQRDIVLKAASDVPLNEINPIGRNPLQWAFGAQALTDNQINSAVKSASDPAILKAALASLAQSRSADDLNLLNQIAKGGALDFGRRVEVESTPDSLQKAATDAMFKAFGNKLEVDQLVGLKAADTIAVTARAADISIDGTKLDLSQVNDALAARRSGEINGLNVESVKAALDPNTKVIEIGGKNVDLDSSLREAMARQFVKESRSNFVENIQAFLAGDNPDVVQTMARAVLSDASGKLAGNVIDLARGAVLTQTSDRAARDIAASGDVTVTPARLEQDLLQKQVNQAQKDGQAQLAKNLEILVAEKAIEVKQNNVDKIKAELGSAAIDSLPMKDQIRLAQAESDVAEARVAGDQAHQLVDKNVSRKIAADNQINEANAAEKLAALNSKEATSVELKRAFESDAAMNRAKVDLIQAQLKPETTLRTFFGAKPENVAAAENAFRAARDLSTVDKAISEKTDLLNKIPDQINAANSRKSADTVELLAQQEMLAKAQLDAAKTKRTTLDITSTPEAKAIAAKELVAKEQAVVLQQSKTDLTQATGDGKFNEKQAASVLARLKALEDVLNKAKPGEALSPEQRAELNVLKNQALDIGRGRSPLHENDLNSRIEQAKTAAKREPEGLEPAEIDTDAIAAKDRYDLNAAIDLATYANAVSEERLGLIIEGIKRVDAALKLNVATAPGDISDLKEKLAGLDKSLETANKDLSKKTLAQGKTIIDGMKDQLDNLNEAMSPNKRDKATGEITLPDGRKTTLEHAQDLSKALAVSVKLGERALTGRNLIFGDAVKDFQRALGAGDAAAQLGEKAVKITAAVNALRGTDKATADRREIMQNQADIIRQEIEVINQRTHGSKDDAKIALDHANELAGKFKESVTRLYEDKYRAAVEGLAKTEFSKLSEEDKLAILTDPAQRSQILEQVFGHADTKSLTEAEAVAYSELMAREILTRGGGMFDYQIRMIMHNLTGNVVEVAMGGGKSLALSAVFGIRALMGETVQGHLVVADEKEIEKYIETTDKNKYEAYMKSLGIAKVADGDALYNKGKDSRAEGYKALTKHLSEDQSQVTVFSLDAYGHLARARKEGINSELSKVWSRTNTIGADEADVAATLTKTYNVGTPLLARGALKCDVYDLYNFLAQGLARDSGRFIPTENLDQGSPTFEYGLTRDAKAYFSDGIRNAAIKEFQGKYSPHDIEEVLRGMEDLNSSRVVVDRNGEVHKSSLNDGFQYQTKDQSDFYQIAVVYESMRLNTVDKTLGRDVAIKTEINLTSHGSEATVSEAFTRVGGRNILVFGASGTLEGAEAIARTVYGAENVVSVKPSSFDDFMGNSKDGRFTFRAYASDSQRIIGEKSNTADFVAKIARESLDNRRGFLGIFGGNDPKASLQDSLKSYFEVQIEARTPDGSQARADLKAQLKSYFDASRRSATNENMDRIGLKKDSSAHAQSDNSFMDLAASDRGVIGQIAKRVVVLDEYSLSKRMDVIAGETGVYNKGPKEQNLEGKAVFAVARAGRALDFKGELNLVVVGAESFDRADLLQILGRTGRSGEKETVDATRRFATDRYVIADKNAINNNLAYMQRMMNALPKGSDLAPKLQEYINDMRGSIEKGDLATVLQANSSFLLMERKAGATAFRLSSEVVTKLAKEPMGILMANAAKDTDSRIMQQALDNLRNGRYDTSRTIYKPGDFRSPEEIAKETFLSGLNQAKGLWKDLAQNTELNGAIRAEAAARWHDIADTEIHVDDYFNGKAKESNLTFAKIDPTRSDISRAVAEVSAGLSRDLLPSETRSDRSQEQSVVMEVAKLAKRAEQYGTDSISSAELSRVASLARKTVATNPEMQNTLVSHLAIVPTGDVDQLRSVVLKSPWFANLPATTPNRWLNVLPASVRGSPLVGQGVSIVQKMSSLGSNYSSSREQGAGRLNAVRNAIYQGFGRSLDVSAQIQVASNLYSRNPDDATALNALRSFAISNPDDILSSQNFTGAAIAKTAEEVANKGITVAKTSERQREVTKALEDVRQIAATAPPQYRSIGGFDERRALNDKVVVATFDPRSDSHFDRAVELTDHSQASRGTISVFLNPTAEARQDVGRMDALRTAVRQANDKGASVFLVGEDGAGLRLTGKDLAQARQMPVIPISIKTQVTTAASNLFKSQEAPFNIDRLVELQGQMQNLIQQFRQPAEGSQKADPAKLQQQAQQIQEEIAQLTARISALAPSYARSYALTHPSTVSFRKDPVQNLLNGIAQAKTHDETMKAINDFVNPPLTTRQMRRIAADAGIPVVSVRPGLNKTPLNFVNVQAPPITATQAFERALSAPKIKALRVNKAQWNVTFGKFMERMNKSQDYQGKSVPEQVTQLEKDVKAYVQKLAPAAQAQAERIFIDALDATFPKGQSIAKSIQDAHIRDAKNKLLAQAPKDMQTIWVAPDDATIARLGTGHPVITAEVYQQYQNALHQSQADTRAERLKALPASWKTGLAEAVLPEAAKASKQSAGWTPAPILTSNRVSLTSGLLLGVAGVAYVMGAPVTVSATALVGGLGILGGLLVYRGGLDAALPQLTASAPDLAPVPEAAAVFAQAPGIAELMPDLNVVEMPAAGSAGIVGRNRGMLTRAAGIAAAFILVSNTKAEGLGKAMDVVQGNDPTHALVSIAAITAAFFFRRQIASGVKAVGNQMLILTNA